MEDISIECGNLPEDENNGSDNFNSKSHEVSPANDLEDREGNTDEDKKAEFDLVSSRKLSIYCFQQFLLLYILI